MTPEFKKAWLENLSSGMYPKTVGHLKDAQGYCCLGVALETYGVIAWVYYPSILQGAPNEGTYVATPGTELIVDEQLSLQGLDAIGLDGGQQADLIAINDENTTFAEVIDYIERFL